MTDIDGNNDDGDNKKIRKMTKNWFCDMGQR